MYHPTPSAAFIMYESAKTGLFTPCLYGRREPLWFCSNRRFKYAFQCAIKWLTQEDLRCRRELEARGWGVQPLPVIDPGPFQSMSDDQFENYLGE